MKKCAIIVCYVNNKYRKDLLRRQVDFFNKLGIDPIVVSSDHVDKIEGVKNYITIKHVSDIHYLSEYTNPVTYIENIKYYKKEAYTNIAARSFFIKLFQCTFTYCKALGYDFCYLLDFDNIINENHVPVAFSDNLDFTKVYFHNFGHNNEYQGAFFYGNINVLNNIFSQDNLKKLQNFAKEHNVLTTEHAIWFLSNQYKQHIKLLPYSPNDVYSTRNMFSACNVADIYFDKNAKEYWFIQVKADVCDNEFACELLLDDVVVYSNKFSQVGLWCRFKLEENKNYTIKYYDRDISQDMLSKVIKVHTDVNNPTILNWIEK